MDGFGLTMISNILRILRAETWFQLPNLLLFSLHSFEQKYSFEWHIPDRGLVFPEQRSQCSAGHQENTKYWVQWDYKNKLSTGKYLFLRLRSIIDCIEVKWHGKGWLECHLLENSFWGDGWWTRTVSWGKPYLDQSVDPSSFLSCLPSLEISDLEPLHIGI